MTIFSAERTKIKDRHLNAKVFFDPNGGVDIARYDVMQHRDIFELARKMRGQFWVPSEVNTNKDAIDFKSLSSVEQHIFTANLKRQILLDSVQGRAPTEALARWVGVPELETAIIWWTAMEQIHNESYSHIIDGVYPSSQEVFDSVCEIDEIAECSESITKYYDDLIKYSNLYQVAEDYPEYNIKVDLYHLKKLLWLCLHAINALEGIRFYVSFACSWAFAENKLMEGNAKIIKLIARDENLHLALTQKLIKTTLVNDDSDFIKIREETLDECNAIMDLAISQEKDWAGYVFRDGSMLGMNENIMCSYVDYIGAQRKKAINLDPDAEAPKRNPLPWTLRWTKSAAVQNAPQETEIDDYEIGGYKLDIDKDTFADIEL